MGKQNNSSVKNSTPKHLSNVLVQVCLCSVPLICAALTSSAQSQPTQALNNQFVTSNTFAPAHSGAGTPQLNTAFNLSPTTTGDSSPISSATSKGFHGPVPATSTIAPQSPQQRSLKFTLIAGKYWKFKIGTNSLQTKHREKELRLHRNVSTNNFIIDDDGWFQYNHQQQQLFAWPSYNLKPATYYFVLLPSSLDYEAGGENLISNDDVVANIVVELIEPYTTTKLDLDQLVDHKFSLEYLHRHSSYPLLLAQIVSVFDTLARSASSNSAADATTTEATTTTTATTTSSVLAALQQNKQARLSSRLSEFLLIDARASPDGEYFSITWTTHPSLANNSPLLPINDCRLGAINETLSKLSSRSILYPNGDDQFVISYSLEGPLVNSQAIIPTELGNYAIKLALNNPCRRKKILDELGHISPPGAFIGLATGIDETENNIVQHKEGSKLQQILTTTAVRSAATAQPSSLGSESERSIIRDAPASITSQGGLDISASEKAGNTSDSGQEPASSRATTQTHSVAPVSPVTQSQLERAPTPKTTPLVGSPSEELQTAAIENQNTIPTARRALETSTTQVSSSEEVRSPTPAPPLLQSNPPPQAKSFVDFLEPSENPIRSTMMAGVTDISTSLLPSQSNDIQSNVTAYSTTETSSLNATSPATITSSKSGQESSINDDLIGILNETTEFLLSIAVPLSIVLGVILIASILFALCNLCMKRRKSKQFEVGDRFKFRYGSERKGFLKNSSKPVILEADQKSLSMGGTPLHNPRLDPYKDEPDKMPGSSKVKTNKKNKNESRPTQSGSGFFAMTVFSDGAASSDGRDAGGDGARSGRNGFGAP